MAPFSDQDFQILRQLEEDLWRTEVRFSLEKMDALLLENFVEFGSSGRVYDRQTVLATPLQQIVAPLPLADFSINPLADSIALITYRSILNPGQVDQKEALRSSLWIRTEAGWRLRFHQGTPIPLTTGATP